MALLIIAILKGNRELEVRTATYGPGIDQSQHAKAVSHIIKLITFLLLVVAVAVTVAVAAAAVVVVVVVDCNICVRFLPPAIPVNR